MSLCFRVVEVVAALGGAAAAFEQAYPQILALWEPVRGLLMPEYFWDRGFEPKDPEQMRAEAAAARVKIGVLQEKYRFYTDEQKLAVERTYHAMLRELGAADSGTSSRPVSRP